MSFLPSLPAQSNLKLGTAISGTTTRQDHKISGCVMGMILVLVLISSHDMRLEDGELYRPSGIRSWSRAHTDIAISPLAIRRAVCSEALWPRSVVLA